MIRIIRPGNVLRHIRECDLCSCIFEFNDHDILDNDHYGYIFCPSCGKLIRI